MYKIPLQNPLISTKGALSRLLQLLSRHLRRENLHWLLECFGAGKSCAAAICWSMICTCLMMIWWLDDDMLKWMAIRISMIWSITWWYDMMHHWSICCNDLQCLMTIFIVSTGTFNLFHCSVGRRWKRKSMPCVSLLVGTGICQNSAIVSKPGKISQTLPVTSQTMSIFGEHTMEIHGTYPSYPEAATSTHNRPQIWPQLLWKRRGQKDQKGLPESAVSFRAWRCGEPHRCHHNPPTHAEASWGASSRWIRWWGASHSCW